MKTYNNEKFRLSVQGLSNHKGGHSHTYILNNIKVGDEWIDGLGTLHICTFVKRSVEVYPMSIVERVIAKKDGTIHQGRKAETFIKWIGSDVWKQSK